MRARGNLLRARGGAAAAAGICAAVFIVATAGVDVYLLLVQREDRVAHRLPIAEGIRRIFA